MVLLQFCETIHKKYLHETNIRRAEWDADSLSASRWRLKPFLGFRCKHTCSVYQLLCSCSSVLFSQQFSQCTVGILFYLDSEGVSGMFINRIMQVICGLVCIGDANRFERFSSIWWTGSTGSIEWFDHKPDITRKQTALPFWTLICIIQRQDEKKKYHVIFSKDSKFLSDIHSYKFLPLIESRFV